MSLRSTSIFVIWETLRKILGLLSKADSLPGISLLRILQALIVDLLANMGVKATLKFVSRREHLVSTSQNQRRRG